MCLRWQSSCTTTLSMTSGGVSISRQLKLRFPCALQLPQRVRCARIVTRP